MPITIVGDTWWVIIICPCVNVFSLMGGVTEADVGFPTERYFFIRILLKVYVNYMFSLILI
jgi:hypothetical protein